MKKFITVSLGTALLLLASCSNDEPQINNETTNFVSKADFDNKAVNKMWIVDDAKTVMSDGTEFNVTVYKYYSGNTGLNDAIYITPDKATNFWTTSMYYIYNERFVRKAYSYSYVETSGEFRLVDEGNDKPLMILKKVSDSEMIAYKDFGIVPKNFDPEKCDNNPEYFDTSNLDEGSYTKVILRPATDEETQELWNTYVEVE